MYYLVLSALLCYFLGEYLISPVKPSPLMEKSSLLGFLIRFSAMSALHLVILGLAFGFWGIAFAGALILFHMAVDLLTRPFFNMVTGKRVLLTLIDLVLHVVCMYAASVLISLIFTETITYNAALILRYGAATSMGAFFFPAIAKTLLVDGFPRYYSERPLFSGPEWFIDAAFGLVCALSCAFFVWWIAAVLAIILSSVYFLFSSQLQKGRPVLALSKAGVLLILAPCFFSVFNI